VKKGDVMCGLTFCDVDGVTSETRSLPHQGAFLRKEFGDFSAYELVADRLVAVWVELVRVDHVPSPGSDTIVVTNRLLNSRVLCSLGVEGISVKVLLAAHLTCALRSVDLVDCVVWTINIGVDPQTEKMLMIVGVDSRINFCSPSLGVFTWVHGICVQDTSELDFELNSSVLMEDPVNAVFVVCCSENVRDDKLSASCDDD
jgi:hypothetical protein